MAAMIVRFQTMETTAGMVNRSNEYEHAADGAGQREEQDRRHQDAQQLGGELAPAGVVGELRVHPAA